MNTLLFGLQLENLLGEAEDILIANNTVLSTEPSLRLWDDSVKGKNIQVRNNLFLGAALADMVFLNSGGQQFKVRGPGDYRLIHKAWQMDHNWREGIVPKQTKTNLLAASWIPPVQADVRHLGRPINTFSIRMKKVNGILPTPPFQIRSLSKLPQLEIKFQPST